MVSQWTPGAVAALRQIENLPFVRADASGDIVETNPRFDEVYGWQPGALIGQSLAAILPASFREFHHAGFARFQLTESSKVVNHPLTLATVCSDGTELQSEHYIVAEKYLDGSWSFAATLRPLEGPHASSGAAAP
jgi:PAS domain S-box-containing protein